MLSYRHGFHAGNFADVFKHALLVQLLQAMQRKENGFFYLETHSGAGRYDLQAGYAQKNREHAQGIERIWQRGDAPEGLATYLQLVRASNKPPRLSAYPGSPSLAAALLRPQDRALFCELHPADFDTLSAAFKGHRRIRCERRDGLQAIKASLPPLEKRALVHIDPAYERAEEYRQVIEAVVMGRKRFAGGVFALWYPLLSSHESQRLARQVVATGMRNILQAELWVRAPGPGMYGSGMLVFNPPWQTEQQFRQPLSWLQEVLADQDGGCRLEWLAAE